MGKMEDPNDHKTWNVPLGCEGESEQWKRERGYAPTAPAPPVAWETEPTGEQIEIAACAYADAAEKPSVDMHGIRAALRAVLRGAPAPPTAETRMVRA